MIIVFALRSLVSKKSWSMESLMVETPNKKKIKGLGRVRFRIHIATIRTQLEAGWPKKAVLDNLKNELDMSYQQFLRYVREYIEKNNQKTEGSAIRSVEQSQAAPQTAVTASAAKAEPERPK
jgi:hypothetical protein